jgi:hypothetical protein
MAGLKAFLPEMAKVLGTTADALYSRQRALIRLGVLKAVEGRGPGSGVALSAEAVAAIIIALMAADSLQETDERVRRTCNAEAEDKGVKPLQLTLAAFLSSPDRKLQTLTIEREQTAMISYGDAAHRGHAIFRIHKGRGPRSVIRIAAVMPAEPIQKISKSLGAALGDTT